MIGALWSNVRVYVVTGATDMRKSFDTLAGIVKEHLGEDPLSGQIFAFSNRRRDRLKLLVWDGTGLWVCAKRLEKGTFSWPSSADRAHVVTADELSLLIAGIDLTRVRRREWYERGDLRANKKEHVEKELAEILSSC